MLVSPEPFAWFTVCLRKRSEREINMRTTVCAVAAVAFMTAVTLPAGAAPGDPIQLAQAGVDVRVGPPLREHGPGAVLEEEHHRPGVVIEGTEGRGRRDCVTHSESVTRNGTTVTEQRRECAR
jgi:hypothetical protein